MGDKIIVKDNQWTFDYLEKIWVEIERVAKDYLKLDMYPNQIEIVTSEQMLDAYSLIGLPISYPHWKFGKDFMSNRYDYLKGYQGLAYELVINSNPCISYNMEDNSAVMQALVLAHAACGHNSFFKNNYLFKQWTDASSIIDYMVFAKNYVTFCEEKYGADLVETILDACHALMDYGIDSYKKPAKLSLKKEEARLKKIQEVEEENVNDIWRTVPSFDMNPKDSFDTNPPVKFPAEPEENILYFIEKNAPNLEPWKKELVRIVRKTAQYFSPQGQCLIGDTYVNTESGLIKFKDLINEEGYNEKKINVLSIDNKFEETSHFYKRKTNKTFRIKTKLGKVIEGTPEHPVLIFNSNLDNTMIKLENLKIGEFLVTKYGYENAFSKTNYKINYKLKETEDLVECLICNKYMQNLGTHLKDVHKTNTNEYRVKFGSGTSVISETLLYKRSEDFIIPKEINCDIARFLGYLISEGSCINRGFGIGNTDLNILKDIEKIFLDNFNIKLTTHEDKREHINGPRKTFYSTGYFNQKFDDFLDSLGLKRTTSYYKEIPKCILQSSKEVISHFLKALFEGDGSNFENGQICYTSRSGELIKQIQLLLQNFGIISRYNESSLDWYKYKIKVPDKICYSIDILTPFYDKFMKEIGFTSERKNKNYLNKRMVSIATEGVPYLNDYIEKIKYSISAHPIKDQKIRRSSLPLSRSKNFKFEHLTEQINKFEIFNEIDSVFYSKIKKNILDVRHETYYDEIISIEEINEEKDVYDFTIPSNHLFMSNGIISHNTKVMNEGWATMSHYLIINKLYEEKIVDDGFMIEFLKSHTNVISQPEFDSPYYSGINPYTLGFNIFMDIKRICENPTDEDKKWFPNLIGKDWLEEAHYAMENFKDDSFVLQYLSPKVIRDMKLFLLSDDSEDENYHINAIHNERGYEKIREKLSVQYSRSRYIPNIQITHVDKYKTRRMSLSYYIKDGKKLLESDAEQTVNYLQYLWEFPVRLYEQHEDGKKKIIAKAE